MSPGRIFKLPHLLLGLHLGAGPVIGLLGSGALLGGILSGKAPSALLFFAAAVPGLSLGVVPSNSTMLASGAAFGWIGAPFLFLALLAASLPGFLVIRHRFRDEVRMRLQEHPKAALAVQVLDAHGLVGAILLRIAPVSTFAWTNALLAVSSISLPRFVLTTALGIAPRILLLTWAGGSAMDIARTLRSGTPSPAALLALGLSLASLAGLAWIAALALRKAGKAGGAVPEG